MSPEKQRIAIAKVRGYTHVRIVKCIEGPPDHCIGHHPTQPHSVPDYPNDLNACREMEETLTDEQYADYALMVCGSVNHRPLSANAAQRAEAFLKTLNLWEE
jgi:hypothetical protein